jgi:hypothetical protein
MTIAVASDNLQTYPTDGVTAAWAFTKTFRKPTDLYVQWRTPANVKTDWVLGVDYGLSGDFEAGATTLTRLGLAPPAGTLLVERLTPPRQDLVLNDSQNLNSHNVETKGLDDLARQIGDWVAHLSRRIDEIALGTPSFLHCVEEYGVTGDAPGLSVTNTVALRLAMSTALAGRFRLYGNRDYYISDNLPNFHAVRDLFWGPGAIIREGVQYKFEPTADDTAYYYADIEIGLIDSDGLSPSFPRLIAQDLVDAIIDRKDRRHSPVLLITGEALPGTQDLRIVNYSGGDFYLGGVNPDPNGPTRGINVQPLTVFDGRIAAGTVGPTVGDTTHFALPFAITPNPRASLKIYVDDVDADVDVESDVGGDDERGGWKLTLGALTDGVALTPTVDFHPDHPVPDGKTVLFEWGLTAGLNISNSETVFPRHMEFARYSNKQVGYANSRVIEDNLWKTGGSQGLSVNEHCFYSPLGGVFDGQRKFQIGELFGNIRHFTRSQVVDEWGFADLAASRARGSILKNGKNIAIHSKELNTGHTNNLQIYDCAGDGVLASRMTTFNLTGVVIWRSAKTAIILENGSVAGGGSLAANLNDLGIATVNANAVNWDYDRNSNFISSETSSAAENDRGLFGLAGRAQEFMGSFPNESSPAIPAVTSSAGPTGDFIVNLSQSHPGSLQRKSTFFEYLVDGVKTGAAADIGQLLYRVVLLDPLGGPPLEDTITALDIPADATWFRTLFRVVSFGPSSQWLRSLTMHNGAGENPKRQDFVLTIPFEDASSRIITLRHRVANAGDQLKVYYVGAQTTERRQVENIG